MSYIIATDTCANIPTATVKKEGIVVVPLSYHMDEKEFVCLDTEKFNSEEYYNLLKDGKVITTSQINPQKYIEYMESYLKEGKDILFIGISSGVSGSFASAKIAKEQLEEQYPERKVKVVDSGAASMGEGLLVLDAVEAQKAGKTIEETEELIINKSKRLYQIFTVDDLMYLKRGGRLSGAVALVGTLLHIKPILKGNEHGKIVPCGKTRGRKAAITHIAEKFEKLCVNPENNKIAISHANCKEDAELLAKLVKEKSGIEDIIVVDHEPVTGAHLGMGGLALYFFGDEKVRLS